MRMVTMLLMMVMAAACGSSTVPSAPTPLPTPTSPATPTPPPTVPSSPTSPSVPATTAITSFSVTGQLIEGTYHYWPALSIVAGSGGITIRSVIFRLPGVALTRDRVYMDWYVPAGGTYGFSVPESALELLGGGPAAEATVTVTYTDADGHAQQMSANGAVARIESAASDARLRIDGLTVVRWLAGSEWNYWARLNVTEVTNRAAVTITRVEFMLPDLGDRGRVPPVFGSWTVPAGGTRELFADTYRDEPNLYVSSPQMTDRFRIMLAYVDESGRPGEVTAEAMATPR